VSIEIEIFMISFKESQYPKGVILFAVFFYVRYTVSYRDVYLLTHLQCAAR
jgi:transposase-like protein